jgi:hypothetical protein
MNYKKLLFACGIIGVAIGFVINCNSNSSPTAPATSGLVGVWTGALSNRGGGGAIMTNGRDSVDASGTVVLDPNTNDTIKVGVVDSTNATGDTLWNYDSMGVVLKITTTKYSIVRGDKVWGSSNSNTDSLKSVGSWAIMGNKAIFTPKDSCLWKDETHPWTKDDGILYSCLPADTLTIDTTGNTWSTPILNAKLAISQPITLTKQH